MTLRTSQQKVSNFQPRRIPILLDRTKHEQTIHESTRHGPYHLYVLSSMANAEGGAYRFTCSLL